MPYVPSVSSTVDTPSDGGDVLDPRSRRHRGTVRLGVGAAVVLLLGSIMVAVVVSAVSTGSESTTIAPTAPRIETATPEVLLVHVLGAVARPGLVELGADARVVDAIAGAGGLTEEADTAGVNLARSVNDGEQLIVPRVGDVPPPLASAPGGSAGTTTLVNLNTADAAMLETLPRIGPALAARIIAWREANGGFASVDELRSVSGIGAKVFADLRELVTT